MSPKQLFLPAAAKTGCVRPAAMARRGSLRVVAAEGGKTGKKGSGSSRQLCSAPSGVTIVCASSVPSLLMIA